MRYNVRRYYEEPDPKVHLHANQFAPVKAYSAPIVSTLWDNEVMVYLPDPTSDPKDPKRLKQFRHHTKQDLIEVGHHRISVEVLPLNTDVAFGKEEGFRVLYGKVVADGVTRSAYSVKPFTRSSTKVGDGKITGGPDGAIILRFTPIIRNRITDVEEEDEGFVSVDDLSLADDRKTLLDSPKLSSGFPSTDKVPVKTLVKSSGVPLPSFKFVKVEDLYWGAGFKGVNFYNMSGFYFRFAESKTHIAHMQFWTAGKYLIYTSRPAFVH